ncbi:MAG TPA: hypothetical protein VH595_13170 [Verrucomicrobiae bacterium]|nr:hypothetical protein [Verrucomicrobiae bacterium]
MKIKIATLLLMLLSVVRGMAQPATISFTNKAGEVFSNVTVIGSSPTEVYYEVPGGGDRIRLADLPPQLQQAFHYDPSKDIPKPSSAPRTNAVARRAAAPVVPQYAPGRKIIGGFGWKLGQTVPPDFELYHGADGSASYVMNTTNFPPFDNVDLSLLADGRIYAISASGSADEDFAKVILSTLVNKYGPAKTNCVNGWETDTITDGFATIACDIVVSNSMIMLSYQDDALKNQHEAEQRARDTAAKSKALNGL